jgi:acetoin utilization deacetylase AcuC-like enzyme
MTLLYTDYVFLRHETGAHPETPNRLRSISAQLAKTGLDSGCARGSFHPVTVATILGLHSRRQLERVKQLADSGGGMLDADTMVSGESFAVALAAAGAAASAVDAVLAGPERNALCLVRPPGHHATPTQSMGFCLFNNIALAANHALTVHHLSRLLVVDFDVHHGNGTQDIFYEDPRVLFMSIHRYGVGFYPGTGAAGETGSGKGLGYTLNVPVRFGTSRREYHERFALALAQAADKIKPELVLASAGFDAHVLDPIGSLELEVEDFATLTDQIIEVARSHCQGRLVSCLEGGYHLQALAESVQAHLERLVDAEK